MQGAPPPISITKPSNIKYNARQRAPRYNALMCATCSTHQNSITIIHIISNQTSLPTTSNRCKEKKKFSLQNKTRLQNNCRKNAFTLYKICCNGFARLGRNDMLTSPHPQTVEIRPQSTNGIRLAMGICGQVSTAELCWFFRSAHHTDKLTQKIQKQLL